MTDQKAMALYTRLFEWLGEKPPKGYTYDAGFGGYCRIFDAWCKPSYSFWPCEQVDWNAVHVLIEKTAKKTGWVFDANRLNPYDVLHSIAIANGIPVT